MIQRTDIHEGMLVRSRDGENLGKVFAVGDTRFQVEKGLFFPKDYLVSYADVQEIRDGEIILLRGRDSLLSPDGASMENATMTELGNSGETRATQPGLTGATTGTGLGDRPLASREDVRTVQLKEEELDILKREREAGSVQLQKDVITEQKVVDVPIRKERVQVEHRAVPSRPPAPGASFQEETVTIPVREEEVEVRKRPVVKGEVVVRKEGYEEQRRVAETVRKETVKVKNEGDVEEASPRSAGILPGDDPDRRF